MSDALDPSEICRDEACDRRDVHRKHLVATRPPPTPHHRPKRRSSTIEKPEPKTPLWQRNDPRGLTGAVARATSNIPRVVSEIIRDVRDDYGNVSERSIYRHIEKLVERGNLIRIDIGLKMGAYIRPKSRMLKDPDAIRDYVDGEIEYGRACTCDARSDFALA